MLFLFIPIPISIPHFNFFFHFHFCVANFLMGRVEATAITLHNTAEQGMNMNSTFIIRASTRTCECECFAYRNTSKYFEMRSPFDCESRGRRRGRGRGGEGEETDKLSELVVEYVNVPGTTTISHCRNVNMTNLQSRNSISTNKNQIPLIANAIVN